MAKINKETLIPISVFGFIIPALIAGGLYVGSMSATIDSTKAEVFDHRIEIKELRERHIGFLRDVEHRLTRIEAMVEYIYRQEKGQKDKN